MYVMSIMFGYFIRRVDKRFQLERSAGLLEDLERPQQDTEALSRLERLFNDADSLESAESPDSVSASRSSGETSTSGQKSEVDAVLSISLKFLLPNGKFEVGTIQRRALHAYNLTLCLQLDVTPDLLKHPGSPGSTLHIHRSPFTAM